MKKVIIGVFLILLLLIFQNFLLADQVIEFKDYNLEKAVIESLDKEEGSVYLDEVEKISPVVNNDNIRGILSFRRNNINLTDSKVREQIGHLQRRVDIVRYSP